jgi:hypothetical protein
MSPGNELAIVAETDSLRCGEPAVVLNVNLPSSAEKGTEEANSHFSDSVFSGCTKNRLIRGIKSRPAVNQSLV